MWFERLLYEKIKPPLMLFDFDGVISNSIEIVYPEVEMVFAEVGFDKLKTREEVISLLDGNVFLRLAAAGFPIGKLKWLGHKFKPQLENLYSRIDPFPGIVEVVNHLSNTVPVYIITGNRAGTVAAFCVRHGIEGIREIIGSDVERSKVKSIRRITKQHRDRTPYYIGDTLGDMREAHKAGVRRIGASWGWHGRERLAIAKPEYIVDSPEILLELFRRLVRAGEEGKEMEHRLGRMVRKARVLFGGKDI